MEWKPIKTAPIGEDVLLHSPEADCPVLMGHQFDGDDEWYPLHETWLNGNPFDVAMSHWMPLPKPPK